MARFVRFGALAAAAFLAAACTDTPATPDATAPSGAAAFSSSRAASDQVVGGEIIVKMRDGADVDAVAKAHGLGYGYAGYKGAFHVLRGNVGNEHANANALKTDSRVEYAEPNYLRQATTINPN